MLFSSVVLMGTYFKVNKLKDRVFVFLENSQTSLSLCLSSCLSGLNSSLKKYLQLYSLKWFSQNLFKADLRV